MKRLFLSAAFLLLAGLMHATHTLWYYVYFREEFIQGPWTGADLLPASSLYLEPKMFVIENAGSDPTLVPMMALSELKKNEAAAYAWNYELRANGDTLLILARQPIREFDRVKNEVTATMTHLYFRHVHFKAPGIDSIFSQQDIDLPYFELTGKQQPEPEPVTPLLPPDTASTATTNVQPAGSDHRHWPDWLVYGLVGVNTILIALLIFARRKA